MNHHHTSSDHSGHPKRRRSIKRTLILLGLTWAVLAYLLLPLLWTVYEDEVATPVASPRITTTGDHHPGDPLNVALVGSRDGLIEIMRHAGWTEATALGLRADVDIIADSILSRPDPTAPVSNLYLYGRREDIAFEQPSGDNPRHRHHVRFWQAPSGDLGEVGPHPVWIGSAVYDARVGFSHTTGAITHVTAPEIDAERDYLFECLQRSELLASQRVIADFHEQKSGTNGGGDLWETDGDLYLGVIHSAPVASD